MKIFSLREKRAWLLWVHAIGAYTDVRPAHQYKLQTTCDKWLMSVTPPTYIHKKSSLYGVNRVMLHRCCVLLRSVTTYSMSYVSHGMCMTLRILVWWRRYHEPKWKTQPFAEIPESFEGLRDEGIYYVDKTGFITYLITQKRKICVFTRPRRFGKTLMLRMLQSFFEYRLDKNGNPIDNHHYFDGLNVMAAGEDVLKEMGQYPVISLSFKDVSGDTYELILGQLRGAISEACGTHEALLKNSGILSEVQSQTLHNYLDRTASENDIKQFLQIMTGLVGKSNET